MNGEWISPGCKEMTMVGLDVEAMFNGIGGFFGPS